MSAVSNLVLFSMKMQQLEQKVKIKPKRLFIIAGNFIYLKRERAWFLFRGEGSLNNEKLNFLTHFKVLLGYRNVFLDLFLKLFRRVKFFFFSYFF